MDIDIEAIAEHESVKIIDEAVQELPEAKREEFYRAISSLAMQSSLSGVNVGVNVVATGMGLKNKPKAPDIISGAEFREYFHRRANEYTARTQE